MDENIKLSVNTWNRNIDSIIKVGYSDGIVDGQAASFQSSFDMGYKQGFQFGLQLGVKNAVKYQRHKVEENNPLDPRRINCQICINNNSSTENVVNLYNKQLEKNKDYLSFQSEF